MVNPNNSTVPNTNPMQLFSAETAENPFPLFKQLRTVVPIVPYPARSADQAITQQVWLVTRLEEAVQILRDKRFTVDITTIPTSGGKGNMVPHKPNTFANSMISLDDPDHKRLRGLVSKAFTPKYIESLRPHIQKIADELLAQVETNGQMDLVPDYAYPLPINVISDMLGVPPDNRDKLRHWSDALVASFQSSIPEQIQTGQNFAAFISEIIVEKRQHPQDDLISQLIQLEEEGDHLNETELISMISLLVFAGHETTSNLLAIGTLMLLEHPDQFAKLKADYTLIPAAIEELLRFNGPIVTPAPRFASEDVEIGGQLIKQGDVMVTILASVNRDELQFTNPEELDIARELNRHIAFGQGIHACLGAPLARLEAEIAFTTLFKRLPKLHLNPEGGPVKWRAGLGLRGLTSLPVAF